MLRAALVFAWGVMFRRDHGDAQYYGPDQSPSHTDQTSTAGLYYLTPSQKSDCPGTIMTSWVHLCLMFSFTASSLGTSGSCSHTLLRQWTMWMLMPMGINGTFPESWCLVLNLGLRDLELQLICFWCCRRVTSQLLDGESFWTSSHLATNHSIVFVFVYQPLAACWWQFIVLRWNSLEWWTCTWKMNKSCRTAFPLTMFDNKLPWKWMRKPIAFYWCSRLTVDGRAN